MSATRRLPAVLAVAVLALVALAGPAAAHVTIAEVDQTAGAYTALTFQVGHGCEGTPTTEIAIQVPEGVDDVTPEVVAGWDVEIEEEALAEPVEGAHGEEVSTREAVVVYTGNLPDGFRQTFQIGLKVPDDAEGMLFWPTVQTCVEGEHRWVEIPAEGEDPFSLDSPAPFVVVGAGAGGHGGHGDGADEANDAADVDDAAEDDADAAADDAVEAAADGDAVDVTATELAAASTAGGSDVLTVVALVAGVLGLLVGGAGFATARRALADRDAEV